MNAEARPDMCSSVIPLLYAGLIMSHAMSLRFLIVLPIDADCNHLMIDDSNCAIDIPMID
jgi:hypothetical protein